MTLRGFARFVLSAAVLAALTACGGGDSGAAIPVTYMVGGMVTGLTGSGLVLQNNAGGELPVSTTGAFTFTGGLANGAAYAVTVKTQPSSPTQECVVRNGSSTVGAANVKDVMVTCIDAYTIGYTVTGLAGSGLRLGVNKFALAGPDFDGIGIYANGPHTLDATFATGYEYRFYVETQPSSPAQHCVITNGSVTVGTAGVSNVTVTCVTVGRFAYTANAGDNTISVYSIDSATGALTTVGAPVATGTSPYSIAGSPDGLHVYVCNEASNNISAYSVDATSGALTPIPGSPIAAGIDPQAMAFDPSGTYLYVANSGSNDLSAYAVDASSGALTPLPAATYATGTGPSAVAVDPTGKLVFVANKGGSNNISVFVVTAETGGLTPAAGSPFAASSNSADSPYSLALGASGNLLYVATANRIAGSGISGFHVDPLTGVLTEIGEFAVTVDNYIATDRTGAYLFATTDAGLVEYSIDATTGSLSSVVSVAAATHAHAVTVDPSNQLLYVGNDGAANIYGYNFNAANGVISAIAGSPFTAGNLPEFVAIL
jgi:6-phosphogluconolactonase